MRRWLVSLAVASFVIAGPTSLAVAAPQPGEQGIAAIVNSDVITTQELSERIRVTLVTSNVPDDPASRQRLAAQVLRGYIEEKLGLQEAKRLGIDVSNDERDRALDAIAKRNNITRAQLLGFFKQRGVDPNSFSEQIGGQVAWNKVLAREVRPKVRITDDQVSLALRDLEATKSDPEYRLAEILLPVYGQDQETAVGRDADNIYKTLRSGAKFNALARQVSAAPSAEAGGDMGWIKTSTLDTDSRPVVIALRIGEISQPVRTAAGYQLYMLQDKRTASGATPQAKVHIAQIFFPLGSPDRTAVNRAMATADGLRGGIKSCGDISAMAAKQAAGSGDLGWLRLADLPAEIRVPLSTLPVGELSQPIPGPSGVHLVMMCDRQGFEELKLDEDTVRQQLELETLSRMSDRYMRDLRKSAYIDLRLGA